MEANGGRNPTLLNGPILGSKSIVSFYDTPVLVIDDSKAVRTILRDMLEEVGFTELDTAESVADAVETFDKKNHPIVFLDLLMPEASGIRFARHALEKDPYCKIVLTTALPPNNEGVITAISEGAYDILQKPLRKEDVAQMATRLEREMAKVTKNGSDVSYT